MPNIIEQQDLLKGLPDARLMTLLQKPVGDIPPFLVAAEAQRRQQIRQQFAGSGSKESGVDSLTKQLAGVPQNIGSKGSPTVSASIAQLEPDALAICMTNLLVVLSTRNITPMYCSNSLLPNIPF